MARWRPHGILGVVHLPAPPRRPRPPRGELRGASSPPPRPMPRRLVTGGVDGFIVENFGSAPFHKGTRDDPNPPHVVAFMTRVVAEQRAVRTRMRSSE